MLTELLIPHLGVGEIRLMSPGLAAIQKAGRLVMLFDPPAMLSGWALAQLNLDVERLLVIQTEPTPNSAIGMAAAPLRPLREAGRIGARLWALEQALKSGHVGAVLAWLPPRTPAERVRRLQLAAHAHAGPAFILRDLSMQHQPSAAPLRLALRPAAVDEVSIHILKRRGPPLPQALKLPLPSTFCIASPGRSIGTESDSAEAAALAYRLRPAAFVHLA